MILKIVIGYSNELTDHDLMSRYFPIGCLVVEETLTSSDNQYTRHSLIDKRHFRSSYVIVRDMTQEEKQIYAMVYPDYF